MAKRSRSQETTGDSPIDSSETKESDLESRHISDGATTRGYEQLDVQTTIDIEDVDDIVQARQEGRELARRLGFSSSQATLVATAISELARNVVLYARRGKLVLSIASSPDERLGIVIVVDDEGPGIPNLEHAMMSGFSSSGGLGLGLPGVRRIVDDFEIRSELGKGTSIVCTMWR